MKRILACVCLFLVLFGCTQPEQREEPQPDASILQAPAPQAETPLTPPKVDEPIKAPAPALNESDTSQAPASAENMHPEPKVCSADSECPLGELCFASWLSQTYSNNAVMIWLENAGDTLCHKECDADAQCSSGEKCINVKSKETGTVTEKRMCLPENATSGYGV